MEHLHSSPAVCLAAAVPVFATHWLVLPSFTWLKLGAAGHSPAVCGPLLLEHNYLNVFSLHMFSLKMRDSSLCLGGSCGLDRFS